MPTDTFPIAVDSDDGSGYRSAATWPPNAGTFTDEPGVLLFAVKENDGATNYIENLYLRWDTSSLPDNATITAANLSMYLVSRVTTLVRDLVGDYYDFGGEPTVAADYIETITASIFTPRNVGSLGLGAVNNFSLTDLTGINLSGYTGIRVGISSSVAPAGGTASKARFAAHEDTTNQEPRLDVTYTVPDITASVAWITA